MTINQQPDALSLSLNIKDFKIATTTSVPFVLKKGTTELVAQNYEPGQDGFVTISVRDMVHAQLSLAIPPSASPYEQLNIAANFTAVIDGTEVTFRVLRGGVDKLADTAANFLTANFLTWQPQSKAVTYSSPEYLSYYAVVASVAKLKAYFTNAAGEVTSEQTITLHTLAAGKAYTLTTQYAAVSALLSSALPAFYDVWVEDNGGNRLTYIQRYYAGNMQSEQEDWVLFENSLGGMDCFRAYGATNFTGEHTHNLAEIDEVSQEYRVDTERKFEKNTGYLDKEQRRWLLDFFPSRGKYIYTAQALRTIVVTESNVTYTDKELPSNYTFTYKYADATALLNIARTATPTEVLTISVPDLGNFTVPPRLVEVARLPLTEGALFPVQSPYSEEWATTTAGAIFNFVKNLLGSSYEGGGGIGHTHGNLEVLQALSYAAGYLRYDGAKLKAGYADDIPEVINKVITFAQGLKTQAPSTFEADVEFGEFASGMLTGKGGRIDAQGNAEFQSAVIRGSMKVMELLINRLYAIESDYVYTEADTVEEVEEVGEKTYRLTLRRKYDGYFTAQKENNVLFGVINSLANGSGGEYYTAWSRVLSVNTTDNTITVVMYPDNEVPDGVNYPPTKGMVLARKGSSDSPLDGSHNERQDFWSMSSSDGRLLFLQNVAKPILEEYYYTLSIGKLPELEKFKALPIGKDDTAVYAKNIVAENYYQVDASGNVQTQEVYRGAWSADVAASDQPYRRIVNDVTTPTGSTSHALAVHTVYHRGCKWACLTDMTTLEPKWNSPAWQFLEGDSNYSIRFSAYPSGRVRINAVNMVITARVYYGNLDVTDELLALPGTDIQWTRNSGIIPEDNAWHPALGATKNILNITNQDMATNWLTVQRVGFVITVFIPTGDGTYYQATDELPLTI